jgi:hypothetical protein
MGRSIPSSSFLTTFTRDAAGLKVESRKEQIISQIRQPVHFPGSTHILFCTSLPPWLSKPKAILLTPE